MEINIEIDDDLIEEAMKLSGVKAKKSVVEIALRLLVQVKREENIQKFRGKLRWEGNLDEMRSDH